MLEVELLFATRAGVLVVQAAGNSGPSSSSVVSFSPWIISVAASITDREYSTTILLSNGQSLSGTGLARNLFLQIMFWSLRNIPVLIQSWNKHPPFNFFSKFLELI